MKKSMRMAALLLAGSLATTAFVGGTFAKYVTSGTGTDSARVAKFGVEVTANTDTKGFAKTYAKAAGSASSIETTVSSIDFVVAPGTSGTLTDVSISGSPEVAVAVTYEPTLTLTGWALSDQSEYCPIVFTVEGKEYKIDATSTEDGAIKNIDGLKTAVENAIKACNKEYAVSATILGESSADAPSVSWSWPIGEASEKDTYLGDQAATGTAAKIELKIVTTVTQID